MRTSKPRAPRISARGEKILVTEALARAQAPQRHLGQHYGLLSCNAWLLQKLIERSLGAWRDCDVLIALLERKARRIRRADEKQAWEMIRDLTRKKRRGRMRRARRKLANRKLLALVQRQTPSGPTCRLRIFGG